MGSSAWQALAAGAMEREPERTSDLSRENLKLRVHVRELEAELGRRL
jgi:hypothetical protein